MTPTVTLTARGERRLRTGHPWIYRADTAARRAEPGDRVAVLGPRGRLLGHALYSSRSQIAIRMLSYGDTPADDDLIRQRVESSVRFRQKLEINASAYRLVHGEADLLPSLIVDKYGDYLVVQALSQGADKLLPVVVGVLEDLVQPRGILARNDSRTRLLEGLDQRVDLLAGEVPERVTVTQSDIQYVADLWRGQKTGLFLDQRENREAARQYASGRLLDCFTYHGGFALTLSAKCVEAVAIDISREAISHLQVNAELNGVAIDTRVGNVFDELRALERQGQRFETIVLDPPAFAKTKAAVERGAAGYKEINLRALKLLNPGGTLVTCSCSYHISEATLAEITHRAALDADARMAVVEKRMQSRDHPVLVGVPETSYLKCFILRKLE